MHLFHHQQVAAHEEGKEDNKDVKHHGPDHMCPHCGRKLMERGGLLHMWQPISNAFVLNGHCLACHSDEIQAEEAEKTKAEEEEKKEEENQKQEHEPGAIATSSWLGSRPCGLHAWDYCETGLPHDQIWVNTNRAEDLWGDKRIW
eukprot:315669_1